MEIWIWILETDRKWLAEKPQVSINSEGFLVLHLKISLSAIEFEEKGRDTKQVVAILVK